MKSSATILLPFLLAAILQVWRAEGSLIGSIADQGKKAVNGGIRTVGKGAQSVGRGVKDGVSAISDGIKTGVDTVKDGVENILPECVFGIDDISFVLYTREYPDGIVVDMNDRDVPIVRDAKTRFLVHGFTSEANTTNYYDLASAWLEKASVNIFSVQWKDGACTTGGLPLTNLVSYPSAVLNTADVGNLMANFTKKLVDEYGVRVDETIVVGHSLGAHVSGFAGKKVQELGLGKFRAITALDPAAPGFAGLDCNRRICKTDAQFLEVFHTSYLGIQSAIGHDDFYFNSGHNQPGCVLITCSHTRAVEYMTESIRNAGNCTFLGKPYDKQKGRNLDDSECTSETCRVAGLRAIQLPAKGTLYVTTSSEPPYCLDHRYF